MSGATTDNDSLYTRASISSGTSLGTPTSHSSLKGTITLLSEAEDLSTTSFTVTGTDMAGNTTTETITGPTSGNSTQGSTVFKTVSNIVPNMSQAVYEEFIDGTMINLFHYNNKILEFHHFGK